MKGRKGIDSRGIWLCAGQVTPVQVFASFPSSEDEHGKSRRFTVGFPLYIISQSPPPPSVLSRGQGKGEWLECILFLFPLSGGFLALPAQPLPLSICLFFVRRIVHLEDLGPHSKYSLSLINVSNTISQETGISRIEIKISFTCSNVPLWRHTPHALHLTVALSCIRYKSQQILTQDRAICIKKLFYCPLNICSVVLLEFVTKSVIAVTLPFGTVSLEFVLACDVQLGKRECEVKEERFEKTRRKKQVLADRNYNSNVACSRKQRKKFSRQKAMK